MHTYSLDSLPDPPPPSRSLSLSLSRSSTLSARLFLFFLARCSPPFPSLSALSKFLAPSSSLPHGGETRLFPLLHFPRPSLAPVPGTRSHNLRARLPVTYVDAFSRNLVSNLFSLVLSSLGLFPRLRAVYIRNITCLLCLRVYALIYTRGMRASERIHRTLSACISAVRNLQP